MGIRTRKIWHDRRSRKLHKGKSKRNKKKVYLNTSYNDFVEPESYDFMGEYRAIAPSVFSFIDNTEETAQMFSDLIEAIKNGTYKKRFFFDSEAVESVTVDVVLYIIAVMRNIKTSWLRKYTYVGNLPINNEASQVYRESGLYNYVQSRQQKLPANSSKMQILTGKNTDVHSAQQICRFIMDKFLVEKNYTTYIYKTIIEMMSNAVHHAYGNTIEEIMHPCWYMYAEHAGNRIRLIFLDTGLGIATTVRKKYFFEKYIKNDSELMESAFLGEFRSETKKEYRGLGLPALKEYVEENRFKRFCVLSGRGGYQYDGDGSFSKIDLKNKIYGTIYIIDLESVGDNLC